MLKPNNKWIKKIILSLIVCNLFSISWASELPIISGIGGNFSAVNYNHQTIELKDYQDKIILLAFGYTNCADICPFTLGYLKRLYEGLTYKEQNKVQVIFVSIDPKYDTPDHLKEFIGHFNKDFMGLTGSLQQIDHIVSLFQAEYQPLSEATLETKDMRRINPKKNIDKNKDKALLFNHSVTIYLLDLQLRVRSLEYTGTPQDKFTQKIRTLIHD